MNSKILTKIWKESIATLVIITGAFIIYGNSDTKPIQDSVVMNIEELPSQSNEIVEETPPEKIKEVSIEQLVADVESGKAGNGEERKVYLGDRYDEVQKIINEKYKAKETKSSNYTPQKATSGSKLEYQNYAYDLVIAMGWSETDFNNLVMLWDRESNWNPNCHNSSSGAHGIPQSLPANKMATHGSDYYTNGYTQIRWGLDYILNRYGNPTKAWQHFQNKNWY